MFLLVWIILFIGLFLFFYYHGTIRQYSLCRQIPVNLILNADNEGHYRIKGQINEYPVEFLVDTGATLVAIPQNIADRLHIS